MKKKIAVPTSIIPKAKMKREIAFNPRSFKQRWQLEKVAGLEFAERIRTRVRRLQTQAAKGTDARLTVRLAHLAADIRNLSLARFRSSDIFP